MPADWAEDAAVMLMQQHINETAAGDWSPLGVAARTQHSIAAALRRAKAEGMREAASWESKWLQSQKTWLELGDELNRVQSEHDSLACAVSELRKYIQQACYLLHMANGVFVPGNDGANGINADFLRNVAEAGLYDETAALAWQGELENKKDVVSSALAWLARHPNIGENGEKHIRELAAEVDRARAALRDMNSRMGEIREMLDRHGPATRLEGADLMHVSDFSSLEEIAETHAAVIGTAMGWSHG